MLRIMIMRCWPALIPVGLYLLWFWHRRRSAKKNGHPAPHITDGPWLMAAFASVIFFAFSLFAVPLIEGGNAGTHYQPKQLIDGQLVPGKID